jgi:hypothetical protein
MPIFPSDDPAIAAATRKRLRPLIDGYKSYFVDAVMWNGIKQGKSQSRDPWLGKLRWVGECPFDLLIDDIELITSFLDVNRISGFTMFDFEQKVVGNAPGYRTPVTIGTTGGGAGEKFTLPAKEVSALTVEVANGAGGWTVVASTIEVGTGALTEDKAVVTNAQTAGRTVRASFKGRCRYTVEVRQYPQKGNSEWNRQRMFFTATEKF